MVTGESHAHGGGPVQPGGRPPAPGELAVVQAFVNSFFDLEVDRGVDLLATPARLTGWLAARDLAAPGAVLTERDVHRAIAIREGLRGLAAVNNAGAPPVTDVMLAQLNRAAAGARVEVRFQDGRPRFTATGEGLDRALGVLLAITAAAMLDGTWRKLKVCPGHDCGWAFFDHSRNQSGRWCAMSVCGGRAKARAHYHRHRPDTRIDGLETRPRPGIGR